MGVAVNRDLLVEAAEDLLHASKIATVFGSPLAFTEHIQHYSEHIRNGSIDNEYDADGKKYRYPVDPLSWSLSKCYLKDSGLGPCQPWNKEEGSR
jgi:hypothetical protein